MSHSTLLRFRSSGKRGIDTTRVAFQAAVSLTGGDRRLPGRIAPPNPEPASRPMTDEMMTLRGRAEKRADAD